MWWLHVLFEVHGLPRLRELLGLLGLRQLQGMHELPRLPWAQGQN